MKIKFLKNHNGWGKGSVAKMLPEISKPLIEKGIAEETDPGAQELRQPESDDSDVQSPEVKSESKEIKKEEQAKEETSQPEKTDKDHKPKFKS